MSNATKKIILCVDDEKDIVDSLYDTFMDTYEVKTALSGEEALSIFDEEDISLVISDQRMPNMEGSELLAIINERKPICKKILLTGYADINAAVDAINKGSVDRYFSKPWDDDELIKSAQHLISMYDADNFLNKMQKDSERMIMEKETGKSRMNSFEIFLDSYPMGVCITGSDGKIEYVNKKGLEIMRCSDLQSIKGIDVKDIFLLEQSQKKEFEYRYINNDITPHEINVKLLDGSKTGFLGSLLFSSSNNVCGVIFNKPT